MASTYKSLPVSQVDVGSITIGGTIDALAIGTENGQKLGPQRVFVNNLKLQVLAAADRVQDFTYADFGTKNQRIVQVQYTSATFPGVTVVQDINYTLVGNRYRRDSIIWSIL